MSALISTGDFAKDLEPLTGVWVDQGHARYGSEYEKVFKVIRKDAAYFEDQMYSGMGMPRQKPEGMAVEYDKMSQRWGKRHVPIAYALGVNITHESIQDGTALDKAQLVLTELGRGVADLENTVAYNVLNRAFSGSYLGGDGICLCSTSHPTDLGVTSNTLATPAALSEASVKQQYIEMKAMTDLAGNKRKVMPKGMVIPRELIFDAEVLFKSAGRPGTTDNDINAIKSLGIVPGEMVVSDWLSSTTAHFIVTDDNDRTLLFFDREPLMTMRDKDTDTMNAKFVVYRRFGASWSDYNGIFGNAGA